MALVDCREPVYDRQVDDILKMLEEGLERSEIAEKLGYKNPVSLDNYMRRRNFSWDAREKMFVPAAERYSSNNNVLPLHGTSKAALIISLFAQDDLDPKDIAKKVGFETHTQLANHMGGKGYEWDSSIRNYVKKTKGASPEIQQASEPVKGNENVYEMLDKLSLIVNKLENIEPQGQDVKRIPRYQVKGMYGTKAMRMANVLDELTRRYSTERNISQREIFEVALIEFFQKYGYRDEVEEFLD